MSVLPLSAPASVPAGPHLPGRPPPAARVRRLLSRPAPGGAPVAGWMLAVIGQLVMVVGSGLVLRSGLGAVGWDAFHAGVAAVAGLTLGQAGLLTAGICLLAGLAAGWRPGAMVVIAALVGALAVDAVATALPAVHGLWRWASAAGGALVLAAGAGTYLAAAVGESAHDVPLALIRRAGVPLGRAALCVTAATTGTAVLMGGPVGPASPLVAGVTALLVPRIVRRVERRLASWVTVVEVTDLPMV